MTDIITDNVLTNQPSVQGISQTASDILDKKLGTARRVTEASFFVTDFIAEEEWDTATVFAACFMTGLWLKDKLNAYSYPEESREFREWMGSWLLTYDDEIWCGDTACEKLKEFMHQAVQRDQLRAAADDEVPGEVEFESEAPKRLKDIYVVWDEKEVRVIPKSAGKPKDGNYFDAAQWDYENHTQLFVDWLVALSTGSWEIPKHDVSDVYYELSEIEEFNQLEAELSNLTRRVAKGPDRPKWMGKR